MDDRKSRQWNRETQVQTASILCVVPHLNAGGAERVMVNLANHMAQQGTMVTLVSLRRAGLLREAVHHSVEVVELGAGRALSSVFPLASVLRSQRIDALFVMKSYLIPIVWLSRLIARSTARIGFREVVLKSAATHGQRVALWDSRFVVALLYRLVPTIIVPAEEMRRDLVQRYFVDDRKIRVIPNPVDLDRIEFMSRKEPEHAWFHGSEGPLIVGMGRMRDQKGFDILIGAFARLESSSNTRLVLIGDGEARPFLEETAIAQGVADRVAFLGLQANPYPMLARASVFVLSSRFEGFPNALLEAMASGVPAISTDCRSGPAEIIEDGISGLLVPVNDSEAMAIAIERILTAPGLGAKLAEQGRLAVARYAAPAIAGRFRDALMAAD